MGFPAHVQSVQRISYPSSYGDLKLTFCMDVQTTWKPKEFLMFPYVSLPKAAKIHMPSFLKNYAPKLSQNLLQCFRTVWEHPQFNWELIRHIFLVITCSSKWRLVFQPFASSRGRHWFSRSNFGKFCNRVEIVFLGYERYPNGTQIFPRWKVCVLSLQILYYTHAYEF